jgi:hypothetical protein
MYSLKEIMEYGKKCGLSDIQIITKYLTQDGMSEDAIHTITTVLGIKMKELEQKYASARSNLSYSTSYYYKSYDYKTAEMLDTLTRIMILDLDFTKEQIKWMKDFDQNSDSRSPFWHDLDEVIKGIQDNSHKPKFFNNYTRWNNVKTMLDSINNEE